MKHPIGMMNALFGIIKSKKSDIIEIEKILRPEFENTVILFFKQKGYDFQLMSNRYDIVKRYHLNQPSDDFVTLPKFKITPGTFVIKFEWWKCTNVTPTKVYWNPEEITLEDFFKQKLNRAFLLTAKSINNETEKRTT